MGLQKFAVFEAARSRSYAKLFYKNYSIVFFVHFGRGELYLEMMLQDKLANPCQAILMELAICFGQRFGERKSEAERRDGWNEAGAQRPPPCR